MKKKNNEWMTIFVGLRELSKISMPIIASFKIAKIIRKLQEELKDYENTRIKLIKEYSTDDKEVKIPKNKLSKFNDELNTLLNQEVEIEISKISLKLLGEINISPEILVAISDLLEE